MAAVTWSLIILYFESSWKVLVTILLALLWEGEVLRVQAAECPVSAHWTCILPVYTGFQNPFKCDSLESFLAASCFMQRSFLFLSVMALQVHCRSLVGVSRVRVPFQTMC